LEWFVVEKMGEITNEEFEALEFVRSKPRSEEEDEFAHRPVKMRVLGQVRALYASRIQQYAGQHLSRIGVDFVSLPEQPKQLKKEKQKSTSPPITSPPPTAKCEPIPTAKPGTPPSLRTPE
jgi:hypothetical protein